MLEFYVPQKGIYLVFQLQIFAGNIIVLRFLPRVLSLRMIRASLNRGSRLGPKTSVLPQAKAWRLQGSGSVQYESGFPDP